MFLEDDVKNYIFYMLRLWRQTYMRMLLHRCTKGRVASLAGWRKCPHTGRVPQGSCDVPFLGKPPLIIETALS